MAREEAYLAPRDREYPSALLLVWGSHWDGTIYGGWLEDRATRGAVAKFVRISNCKSEKGDNDEP